jgi:hypothetical protein
VAPGQVRIGWLISGCDQPGPAQSPGQFSSLPARARFGLGGPAPSRSVFDGLKGGLDRAQHPWFAAVFDRPADDPESTIRSHPEETPDWRFGVLDLPGRS